MNTPTPGTGSETPSETTQTLFLTAVMSVPSPELTLRKRSQSPYHKLHQHYPPPEVLVPLPPCGVSAHKRGCPGAQLVSEMGQSSTEAQVRPRSFISLCLNYLQGWKFCDIPNNGGGTCQ
ncbi:hypothetical protein EK904_000503 [Melospiza melodia maxima]|nr:hypothetical protein EK904_000503 [Melospiza melodia maxima]